MRHVSSELKTILALLYGVGFYSFSFIIQQKDKGCLLLYWQRKKLKGICASMQQPFNGDDCFYNKRLLTEPFCWKIIVEN
jgi:hypothetical protein